MCSYIHTSTSIYKTTAKDINATVIDTILNYVFKRYADNPYVKFKADLSHCNLCNQEINNLNFRGIDLSFSYLSSIENTILDDANLSRANLMSQSFYGNTLSGAKLSRTIISHTTFKEVSLKSNNSPERMSLSPYCIGCTFEGVNFDYTSIFKANFIACVFKNCSFIDAEILSTNFYACTFLDTSLSNANLLSKNDFSASHFQNFTINTYASGLIFKGCCMANYLSHYITIEERLNEQAAVSSNINSLGFSELYLKDCVFGCMEESDKQAILDKYNELTATKQLPLCSN